MVNLINPYWLEGGGGASDPYADSVILYMQPQVDTSTTMVDTSPQAVTISRFGSGAWSATTAPGSGTTAYSNPGTATDGTNYLSVAASTNQNLDADFTIEGWFYQTGNTDSYTVFMNKKGTNTGIKVERTNGELGFNLVTRTGGVNTARTDVMSPANLNTWNHICVERSGTTVRFYLNGTPSAYTATISGTLDGAFEIGAGTGGDNGDFLGYIGPVRVTKGVARYNGVGFNPTVTAADAMTETTLDQTVNNAHRYWYLQYSDTSAGGSASALSELYWRSTAGGAQQASGGTPFGGTSGFGEVIANAYNGNTSDACTMYGRCGIFGYDFGTAKSIAEVSIKARSDGFHALCPLGFTIFSSDDGVHYIPEWTVTGQTGWTPGEQRTFTRP